MVVTTTSVSKKDINVPVIDNNDNISMRDVIGNQSDSHTGTTLMGRLNLLDEHNHSISMCYPTLGVGVAVPTHGDPWTLGVATEIIPASTITNDYDVHYVSVEALDDNAVYELRIFHGAGTTAAGCVRFTKNANLDATSNVPMLTTLIPANNNLSAQLASSVGASSATISVSYHEY